MDQGERELVRAEERFWSAGGDDVGMAREVVEKALVAEHCQPAPLMRAVQIAALADLPLAFADRVEKELMPAVEATRSRLRLLDQLGDANLSAEEAVFDRLVPFVGEAEFDQLDLEVLKASRAKAAGRPQMAKALLGAIGPNGLPEGLGNHLCLLADELVSVSDRFQASALVVSQKQGLALGVKVFPSAEAGVEAMDSADPAMRKQGQIALSPYAGSEGLRWSLEWPLTFEGSSIGLALKVGGMVACENLASDPLLAATGEVDESGAVLWVAEIEAKLRAASAAGFQRVLLPEENRNEVERLALDDLPELLFVANVKEIRPRVAKAGAKSDFSVGGRTRFLRAAMRAAGLDVLEGRDIPHGKQFPVADAQSEATVLVYGGAKGKATVQGPEGSARQLAASVLDEVYGSAADPKREPRKWKVAGPARRDTLEKAVQEVGSQAQSASGQSEQWRYVLERPGTKAQITQWTTGTLMLQGNGAAFDELLGIVENQLADLPGVAVTSGSAKSTEVALADLPRDVPWAGTDESGKGDYFGPLVSAAVIVDAGLAEQLEALGVRDSKKLSDSRVHKLAPELRRLLQGRYDLTPIPPAKFNPLYSEMKQEGKNLNTLLAWGHARSIEDLLGKGMRPDYVIVDKFADASYMERKLLADTREAGIRLIQLTKAEADIAVAAASILAREAFLAWLERTSRKLGMELPKGASERVKETARRIVASEGEEALGQYAKLFFKTTKEVLAA